MGAIVNALAIIVGGGIGLLVNRGIAPRFHERIMQGIGLCVLVIGISGAIQGNDTIITILSMVIGIIIGEACNFDQMVINLANKFEAKINPNADGPSLSQGFVSAFLLFCIGSMVIVGSLESGLQGDNTTLYTKSLMDGISSILLASSLGAGVLASSIPVLIIEGGLTIFASFLEPVLSAYTINEMIVVGSILLIGLGLNLLNITKLKILNFTPAIFIPIIFGLFLG
ncbi:DUF554 domain-containing protein [Fundicoccus culcitae]|uniref:DUF554 domain-containing protein n=1 Tax=Fundicoccus culcitae TaxID=2969821 RepID=A0ABY5P6E0_9LACT|nr:DUF554 domain-containing protein [Fundicoccus culcitae]UUX33973.1 DUF554 domain-containing protein [Fundicoccus culcitae]